MLARVRRSHVAAAAVLLAAAPLLAGCGSGVNAYTQQQQASGNGQYKTVGDLHLANVTLVRGPVDSKSLVVLATITNVGTDSDALLGASISEPASTATVPGNRLALPPVSSTPLGWPETAAKVTFATIDVPASAFVPLTLKFEKAGAVTLEVLVVPPVGQYAGVQPAA
jgi:copper(I)-binding protein